VQEAAVSLLQRVLFYVGIDWAAETHAVCVLDATGRIRAQFTIGHTAAGFADLLRRLARLTGDPAEVAVGIERPDGRLVDVLLEAGYPVVPVSPNAIKTWRDGEVLSGAKSDAGDAAVIAEYLRLRAHPAAAGHPVHRGNQGAAHRGPHPGGHRAGVAPSVAAGRQKRNDTDPTGGARRRLDVTTGPDRCPGRRNRPSAGLPFDPPAVALRPPTGQPP
jgi:hypothetical protein